MTPFGLSEQTRHGWGPSGPSYGPHFPGAGAGAGGYGGFYPLQPGAYAGPSMPGVQPALHSPESSAGSSVPPSPAPKKNQNKKARAPRGAGIIKPAPNYGRKGNKPPPSRALIEPSQKATSTIIAESANVQTSATALAAPMTQGQAQEEDPFSDLLPDTSSQADFGKDWKGDRSFLENIRGNETTPNLPNIGDNNTHVPENDAVEGAPRASKEPICLSQGGVHTSSVTSGSTVDDSGHQSIIDQLREAEEYLSHFDEESTFPLDPTLLPEDSQIQTQRDQDEHSASPVIDLTGDDPEAEPSKLLKRKRGDQDEDHDGGDVDFKGEDDGSDGRPAKRPKPEASREAASLSTAEHTGAISTKRKWCEDDQDTQVERSDKHADGKTEVPAAKKPKPNPTSAESCPKLKAKSIKESTSSSAATMSREGETLEGGEGATEPAGSTVEQFPTHPVLARSQPVSNPEATTEGGEQETKRSKSHGTTASSSSWSGFSNHGANDYWDNADNDEDLHDKGNGSDNDNKDPIDAASDADAEGSPASQPSEQFPSIPSVGSMGDYPYQEDEDPQSQVNFNEWLTENALTSPSPPVPVGTGTVTGDGNDNDMNKGDANPPDVRNRVVA